MRYLIVIAPAFDQRGNRLHGRFEARLDSHSEILCVSTEPLLDCARILLARGADPFNTIAMTHEANGVITMTSPINVAARYTVQENERGGPRSRRWKAFPRYPVPSPVRSNERRVANTAPDAEALDEGSQP